MAQTTSFDVSTLRWVGKEIDKSLGDARAALEQFAEGSQEPELIDTCVDRLRLVRGTLLMIELHGAAMFAEELEAVARGLREGRGDRTGQASEALMSGLVALPDYLSNLREGAADLPTSLLPLMNDLRAVRDEPLLSETSLFAPGLERMLDAGDLRTSAARELNIEIGQHRRDFHVGLLGWFRGDEASLGRLESAIDGFRLHSTSPRVSRLFEAAAAVVDGVRAGVIESSIAVKRLVGSLDRVLKRVGTTGESDLVADFPYELVKNLLYYVATADPPGTPLIEALTRRYRLIAAADMDVESLQDGSLFGLSADTYDRVRNLLLGEITSIKDRLDVAMHAETGDAAALTPVVPQLRKVSDTLGMIGMGSLRQRLLQQSDSLEQHLEADGEPDTSHLMALASDLVFAESSLKGGLKRSEGGSAAQDSQALPEGELDRYRGAVLAEIGTEFSAIKNAVSQFVEEPHRLDLLEGVPGHLELVSGALMVVRLEPAAALINRIHKFFRELSSGRESADDPQRLEALADSIAGMEYYVELKAGNDSGADGALSYAAQALDRFVPDEAASSEAVAESSSVDEPEQIDTDLEWIAPEEPLSGDAAATAALASMAADADLQAIELEADDRAAPAETVAEADSTEQGLPDDFARVAFTSLESAVDQQAGEPGADEQITPSEVVEASLTAGETEQSDVLAEEVPTEQSLPDDFAPVDFTPVPSETDIETSGSEDDDEIHTIFVEEAREQLASIRQAHGQWRANAEDQDALATLRRGFHTLKGSGRMVGAAGIGEFAWSVENLLNRVIEGTVPVSQEVNRFLDESIVVLPELVDAEAERRSATDTLVLEATAFELAGTEVPQRVAEALQALAVAEDLQPAVDGLEVEEPEVEELEVDELEIEEPEVEEPEVEEPEVEEPEVEEPEVEEPEVEEPEVEEPEEEKGVRCFRHRTRSHTRGYIQR